ncbi:hypothetical protein CROQUDRAFT_662630 [Cronartium quercuum f. sp. fusiforme G11]|uniref:BAR-domain-containing protein n=1 Tax=Cronartium quercuum f. sp. fusiforme G11 TaxID=708437 RepID=A0A9P6N9Y9_9BASI|nr:hypothetical protein CROQUDRAFT_662630 [Cronartium quercuum f. sp. fusiforme G11]
MLKAIKRTPHVITSKVGMAKSSNDIEVDELKRRFTAIEEESAKLLKDAKAYREAVSNMLTSSHNFGQAYITLLSPIANELDLASRYPSAAQTIDQMASYQELITDLRDTIQPELELIDSRITAPVKEFIEVIKRAKKTITKRDHKLIDFDRHNNAYVKLRDKKEKTLKDEQNMFKIEQDYEAALSEYEHYNNLLKNEIPRFLELTNTFISPLFYSFFYMQLNVLYVTFEKLQQFSEGRFDLNQTDIQAIYEARLENAYERIDALSITKRATSTAKILAERRQAGGEGSSFRPPPSNSSSRPPPSLASKPSLGSKPSFNPKAPPPPPNTFKPPVLAPKPSISSKPALAPKPSPVTRPPSPPAPPPYTPQVGSVAAAAAAFQNSGVPLRSKPLSVSTPPPPPKPQIDNSITYVTALYDFVAQAEGDLSFSAGDKIELIKRSESEEDWWTGKLNGIEGVFPGNYVQV